MMMNRTRRVRVCAHQGAADVGRDVDERGLRGISERVLGVSVSEGRRGRCYVEIYLSGHAFGLSMPRLDVGCGTVADWVWHGGLVDTE